MVPLIEEIEALRYMPELPEWVAELFGPELYTAVGRIYGGLPPGGPSMIPDECTIRVDSRPQPGVEEAEVRGADSRAPSSERMARDPRGPVRRRARRPQASAPDRPRPSARRSRSAQAYRSVTGEEPAYGAGSWLADTASTGTTARP